MNFFMNFCNLVLTFSPVRQKDAPCEIHRVHPHTWNYLVIVSWNTIRIFAASARVAFLAGWMYRRPSTGTPEIALIATASFIASSAQEPTLPASTKLENPKIQLNAHIEKGYLVITESNPAVSEPEGRKQRRIPELERGVGMQILKSVAEKYQGSCMSETGNGNYSVSVFLKLGQAKEGNAIYAENSCV